ncbi:MAG: hypothetical protein J6I62_01790, partial [Selenomonadaceae bacterium]|nr:hypothetical protein [Selenomonadaceae bacterium]
GFFSMAVLLWYLIYSIVKSIKKQNITHLNKVFGVCVFFCLLLILSTSPVNPWDIVANIPILGDRLSFLQSSLRLNIFTAVFIAIALSVAICAKKNFLIFALAIAIVNLLSVTPCFEKNSFLAFHKPEEFSLSNKLPQLEGTEADNIFLTSEDFVRNPLFFMQYSDYLNKDIPASDYSYAYEEKTELLNAFKSKNWPKLDPNDITPKDAITNFSRAGLHLDFTANANEPTEIKLPLWFYPHSYGATSDGEEIPVFEASHHRLAVTIPAGEHNVKVFPKLHTPYRNACIISLFGLLAFIIWACIRAYRRKRI